MNVYRKELLALTLVHTVVYGTHPMSTPYLVESLHWRLSTESGQNENLITYKNVKRWYYRTYWHQYITDCYIVDCFLSIQDLIDYSDISCIWYRYVKRNLGDIYFRAISGIPHWKTHWQPFGNRRIAYFTSLQYSRESFDEKTFFSRWKRFVCILIGGVITHNLFK